jgi:hypothetical protein
MQRDKEMMKGAADVVVVVVAVANKDADDAKKVTKTETKSGLFDKHDLPKGALFLSSLLRTLGFLRTYFKCCCFKNIYECMWISMIIFQILNGFKKSN